MPRRRPRPESAIAPKRSFAARHTASATSVSFVISKGISGASRWSVGYSAFGQASFCTVLEGGCRLAATDNTNLGARVKEIRDGAIAAAEAESSLCCMLANAAWERTPPSDLAPGFRTP